MDGIANTVSFSTWLENVLLTSCWLVCKNYDEVKEYLESVRAYDDQQIY
jgi:hypothetical protein